MDESMKDKLDIEPARARFPYCIGEISTVILEHMFFNWYLSLDTVALYHLAHTANRAHGHCLFNWRD